MGTKKQRWCKCSCGEEHITISKNTKASCPKCMQKVGQKLNELANKMFNR